MASQLPDTHQIELAKRQQALTTVKPTACVVHDYYFVPDTKLCFLSG